MSDIPTTQQAPSPCCPVGEVGNRGETGEGEPHCSGRQHAIRPNENTCYCGHVTLDGPVLTGARGVIDA